jgi:hypothetical protein
MRKRARRETYCYVVDNAQSIWATEKEMEHQFRMTKLLPWHLIAKHMGLPKDLRCLIASKVPRNYVRHPVWEFIDEHRDPNKHYKTVAVIYKQDPLYNYKDDPQGKRKRPFYVNVQNQRLSNDCFRHDNVLVWVLHENDHRLTHPFEVDAIIRLDH